jgi:hypothetical protein
LTIRRLILRKDTRVLGSNEITGYLENLDNTLTPRRGLQQWTTQGLQPIAAPVQTGKILLFIQGTFSNSQHLFDEIRKAPGGPELVARATAPGAYDQILAFDHPTLSLSPIVNAVDLREALAGTQAAVDIVCHSRGGLVARTVAGRQLARTDAPESWVRNLPRQLFLYHFQLSAGTGWLERTEMRAPGCDPHGGHIG